MSADYHHVRLQLDGHSYHCASRIVHGDGRCECGRYVANARAVLARWAAEGVQRPPWVRR